MSHVTDISKSVVITDLGVLQATVEQFCPGIEFVLGQAHYRTWKDNHGNSLVGDWPLPRGMTTEQVGEHAKAVLRVREEQLKGLDRSEDRAPYEIGIVPVRVTYGDNGEVVDTQFDPAGNQFVLMTDTWNQGNGILKQKGIGEAAYGPGQTSTAYDQLYMHYRMMTVKAQAQRQGHSCTFQEQKDGTWTADVKATVGQGV